MSEKPELLVFEGDNKVFSEALKIMEKNNIGEEKLSLFLLLALRESMLKKSPKMEWNEFCERLKISALRNHF